MEDTLECVTVGQKEPNWFQRILNLFKEKFEPPRMSNYEFHAIQEFKAAGFVDADGDFKDDMQQLMCDQVLELLDVFAEHGHSGSSAPYAIELFCKLAKFEPLVPLTGEDWEWTCVQDERTAGVAVYQNNRCSHVFKQSDRFNGQPYDIDAIVFWEWYTDPKTGERSKSYFTSSDSMRQITFPYTPSKEYIERMPEAE